MESYNYSTFDDDYQQSEWDQNDWDEAEEDFGCVADYQIKQAPINETLLQKNERQQKKVKTVETIFPLIKEQIEKMKDLLCRSEDNIILLAKAFDWNIEKIQNEYFGNEEKYDHKLGLVPESAY